MDNLLGAFESYCNRMDEVVDGMLQKWKISDANDLKVTLIEDIDQLGIKRFWLVGRLLTSKPYNKGSLKRLFLKLWKTKEEVTFTEWNEDDRFLISFRSFQDRRAVLRGSPWNFENALLLLNVTDGKSNPISIPLDSQNFWIRVRGLPPYLISEKMGKRIGGILGLFIDCDTNRNGDCSGNFLRLRVGVKISLPLHRWLMLSLGGAEDTKFQLEYEDIPHFCLFCGRLSHLSADCELAKDGSIPHPQYGRWKTMFKNVFSIEPDGNLSGQAFGFTKHTTPWRMRAPEPSLIGSIRSREDRDGEETNPGVDMEVEHCLEAIEAVCSSSPKRRRLVLESKAQGDLAAPGTANIGEHSLLPCPIPSGNIQSTISATSTLLSQENVMGESLACQNESCVMGESLSWPLLKSLPEAGGFEGFTGSILNFQNPTDPIQLMGAQKSGPTPISAKTHRKKLSTLARVKPGDTGGNKKSSAVFLESPIPTLHAVGSPNHSDYLIASSPLTDTTITPLSNVFIVGGNRQRAVPSHLPSRLLLDIDTLPKVADLGNTVHLSIRSLAPPIGGSQKQATSSPKTSRSAEKSSTNNGDEVSLNLATNNTNILKSSPGRTPNRPSVMGPVLTHHEP